MTGFDIFALAVLLGSLIAGWFRGGVREVVSLISFALALIVTLLALPVTGPIGRGLIDPDWIGVVLGAVATFLLLYFGIRMLGAALSKGARDRSGFVGGADRFAGLVIGAVRGWVVLGAVHLVVLAALPGDRTPTWLTQAALAPLSQAAARAIQLVLPSLGRGLDGLTPALRSSVDKGFKDDDALPEPQSGPTSPPADPQ